MQSFPSESPRRIAIVGLIALVIVAPWANGLADTLTQVFGLAAAAVCFAVAAWQQIGAGQRSFLPWPAVATAIGALLCCLQLLPIWSLEAGTWQPAAVALRAELVDQEAGSRTLARPLPADSATTASPRETGGERAGESESETPDTSTQAAEATNDPAAAANEATRARWRRDDAVVSAGRAPLTLDVHATRHTLAMLLAGLALFLAAAWLLDTPERLTQAAWPLAGSGALLTLFAVIAKATWNGQLYWLIPLGHPRGVFGPMVYHNQAGAILLLTTAAAAYLVMWNAPAGAALGGAISHRHAGLDESLKRASSPHQFAPLADLRPWLAPASLYAVILLVLNFGGLLLSLSRGALLAALAATLVGFVVVRPRRRISGGWPMLLLAVGGLIASIFYFRMADAVTRRYATLFESEAMLGNDRLAHWMDGIAAGQTFGIFGAGGGAYHHAHLLFQQQHVERTFLRAHNQYLETWVDLGIPGLLLLAIALLTAAMSIRSLTKRRSEPLRLVAAFGVLILVSTSLHAMVDYVLFLPATAWLFAVCLGAVCGVAIRAAHDPTGQPSPRGVSWLGWQVSRRVTLLGSLLLFAGLGGATVWAYRWYGDEAVVQAVPWGENQREIEPFVLAEGVRRLEARLHLTDDYRVAVALGEMKITQFRHRALDALTEENGWTAEEADEMWLWTDPLGLRERVTFLRQAGEEALIDQEIRSEPLIVDLLGETHHAFLRAREMAPAVPHPHLRLGELDFLETELTWRRPHLSRARRLAPGAVDLQYQVGRRLLAIGEEEAGIAAWRRSLELGTRHWADIYAVVGEWMPPEEINRRLLPDDPELLTLVAARQLSEKEQAADRERLLQRAENLLAAPKQGADQEAQRHRLLAQVRLLREDLAGAIVELEAALRYQPDDHRLRARRAAYLLREGRMEEAQQEAQYAARLQPHRYQYRQLLEEIGQATAEQETP